jgi:hypothetical protein
MTPQLAAADAAMYLESQGRHQLAAAIYELLSENARLRADNHQRQQPTPHRHLGDTAQHDQRSTSRSPHRSSHRIPVERTQTDRELLPVVRLVARELVKTHGSLPGEHKIRAALASVGIRVGTKRAKRLAEKALAAG